MPLSLCLFLLLLLALLSYSFAFSNTTMTEEQQEEAPKDGRPSMRDVWSKERLMGKQVSFKGLSTTGEGGSAATSPPVSPTKRTKSKKDVGIDPMLWGQPGHLTEDEVEVYMAFKEQVDTRGPTFRDTVYSFGEVEGECFTLCRWLRARKFVLEDVVKMVEEATKTRAEAKLKDFYPDPKDSLGCDASLFFAQYPQLYTGVAKNGAPLFISKPGVLNVDAVECITTLDGIVKFHWFIMMHDFAERLRAQKARDPKFHRFECCCVLDLSHLTLSQLNSKSLAIIKEQSAIDSLCFPETMSKMFIVNGPRFFGTSWKLIKGWLDPRTASKIEVISDRKNWEKRLLEFVDADQLPVDYGGTGPDTQETLQKEQPGNTKRLHTEVIYVRGHSSTTFELKEGETVKITAFTRSIQGAVFSITDADHKRPNPWVEGVSVQHVNESADSYPSRKVIVDVATIQGPATIKVKVDSNGSRFSTHNFLLSFEVH